MSPDGPTAGALFREGRLADAQAAAIAQVRREPAAVAARVLLAELLLFAGDLQRADRQLDTAGTIDPSLGVAIAEFRQLLRAERARAQLFADRRVPDFLPEGPTAAQRAALACLLALGTGDLAEASRQAEAAEAARPATPVRIDDRVVADFRDADDIIGGSLEVLTPTGKYLWIPCHRIVALTMSAPERPRDLYWRRATLAVADGPAGDVYVPVLYQSDAAVTDDALRLGRATDWRDAADGVTLGIGQRVFLAGDDGLAMMETRNIACAA